jgi:hypothetical protein
MTTLSPHLSLSVLGFWTTRRSLHSELWGYVGGDEEAGPTNFCELPRGADMDGTLALSGFMMTWRSVDPTRSRQNREWSRGG